MTAPSRLLLGTRKSPMAMVQSQMVADLITERTGCQVELVGVTTFGDVSRAQLAQIGGTGVFVSGLRARLLDGDIDIAVHSLKDLPTTPADGIAAGRDPAPGGPEGRAGRQGRRQARRPAVRRADRHRVAAPGRPAAAAAAGSAARSRCAATPDTRLGRVTSGEVDAVVLAYAGLARIGRLDAVTQVFDPDEMLPAPGQGALAVECRSGQQELMALLASVDDAASRAATTAERSLLAALEAGCSAPVGGYAAGADVLRLRAVVVAADGETALRASAGAPAAEAERLGREVAAELLRRGAGRYTAVSTGHIINGDDD